ncbi:malate dehydrogenase [Bacillota bacterium]
MNYYDKSLDLHRKNKGKMETCSKVPITSKEDLSVLYTPGVAQPCLEIKNNPENAYLYTPKGRTIAVVSDGSAVLGLGNIGGLASIPVMEGKCLLFKEFGGVDAFPVCLDTQDVDEIVKTIKNIAPIFGGINLEDFSAPRCFEIERRLIEEMDIPVFHDDQHGTAIVVSAAVINAYKLLRKPLEAVKAVICGAGAAGNAIAKMLKLLGIGDIVICDSKGIVSKKRDDLGKDKMELAELTNGEGLEGSLKDAIKGKDLFIGVSGPNVIGYEDVKKMNKNPVVFALSNPEPEIMPYLAYEGGAAVIGTGRSDFPNQINNVLVFPGIFRGALKAKATRITESMKIAAAYALAGTVDEKDLNKEYILPDPLNKIVADAVSKAVIEAWENR